MKENEKEAEEVADIEQCDQEYLMELKTSIAEQRYLLTIRIEVYSLTIHLSSELDVFRTEVAETTAKLERLKERSAEIEAEQKEARDAISDCERIIQIQKNSTKEEVFQLKGRQYIPLFILYLTNPQRNWTHSKNSIFGVRLGLLQI
jgi:hypothetical protein